MHAARLVLRCYARCVWQLISWHGRLLTKPTDKQSLGAVSMALPLHSLRTDGKQRQRLGHDAELVGV